MEIDHFAYGKTTGISVVVFLHEGPVFPNFFNDTSLVYSGFILYFLVRLPRTAYSCPK